MSLWYGQLVRTEVQSVYSKHLDWLLVTSSFCLYDSLLDAHDSSLVTLTLSREEFGFSEMRKGKVNIKMHNSGEHAGVEYNHHFPIEKSTSSIVSPLYYPQIKILSPNTHP